MNTTVNKISLKNKSILIVEDDVISFCLLEEIFSMHGAIIMQCNNGADAIEACSEAENVDIVLMDLVLSGMNGLTALRKIKAKKPFLPVVVVTAITSSEIIWICKELGASDVIYKPFSIDNITQRVFKLLQENALPNEGLNF